MAKQQNPSVKDIMSSGVTTCEISSSLQDAAGLMASEDVGVLPVVAGNGSNKLVGVVTDRDITCRGVAQGLPASAAVQDVMSSQMVTVREDASANECQKLMESNQIRRIMVTNADGECVGVVAQADIARSLSASDAGETVQEISQPAHGGSQKA